MIVSESREKKRSLSMKVAGGLVKHLGLQMYSGAVPSLAELVSNSWDAMATEVNISIPLGQSIDSTNTIIVSDNGHGMTYDECQNKYLVLGRDRRKKEGDLSQKHGKLKQRKIMSRKGIGKLSGFGIADVIEVRTVKNGKITHFSMSFMKIEENSENLSDYNPTLLEDDGKLTEEESGTTITLLELKIIKVINQNSFKKSMCRRFTILSDPEFSLFVNGEKISKTEMKFQFRFPEEIGKWDEEEILGAGNIKYWFGFTEKPIKDEQARGIVVFCRGKLAQSPWFFDVSVGGYSSYATQYITGEIEADFLDITGGKDSVSTDRGSVRWEESPADLLKEWGNKKIENIFESWYKKRIKKKKSRPIIKEYIVLGERLPTKQRKIFLQYINKLTNIPQLDNDKVTLDELVKFGYNALTNQSFMEIIKELNLAPKKNAKDLEKVLSEWSILEIVSVAQIIKGRLSVIKYFENLLNNNAREVPELHQCLKKYPWLIDPTWETLGDELKLNKILKEKFHNQEVIDDGEKRIDFFCIGDLGRVYVVEIKRADYVCKTTKELDQLRNYVCHIRNFENKNKDNERFARTVGGILIAKDFSSDLNSYIEILENSGIIIRQWDKVFDIAFKSHKEYFKLIKSRAPEKDPRIDNLSDF